MTETKKKPMGSGVTGLVFSIVGLIFALLYPFYLTSEFDA